MKKMTKIESARIIANYDIKKNGKERGWISCNGIDCKDCFNSENGEECHDNRDIKIKKATAYIKRHEQKSKKRIPKYTADVQPDTTGSVLKKIVMKPAKPDPTPLEITKAIRDNNYVCHGFKCLQCPLKDSDGGCGSGVTNGSSRLLRKQLIDSYIAEHDKVKAFEGCEHLKNGDCTRCMKCGNMSCPTYMSRSEPVIEPIKFDDPVPEYVYKVSDSSIKIRKVLRFRRIDEKEADGTRKTLEYIQTNNGDYDFKNCYKTLDGAVAVAKKNWGLE